jgi:hypothetical protein
MKNKPTFQIALTNTSMSNLLSATITLSSIFIAFYIGYRGAEKKMNTALQKAIDDGFLVVNPSGQPS